MIRRVFVIGLLAGASLLPGFADAQGTKLWTVDRYEEMEKGEADGVAIRSDGGLQAGPAASLLYTTGKNYVWSLASNSSGDGYVGLGGTASGSAIVMKLLQDGKATQFFAAKELGVQALRIEEDGSVLAATSPDGKVYRIPKSGGAAAVVFEPPGSTSTETRSGPKKVWRICSRCRTK